MPRVKDDENNPYWVPIQARKRKESTRLRTVPSFYKPKPEAVDVSELPTPHLDQFLSGYVADSTFRKFFTEGGSKDVAAFIIKRYGLENLAVDWRKFLQSTDNKAYSPLLLGTMTHLFEELAEAWMREMNDPTLVPLSQKTTRQITSNLDADKTFSNPDSYLIDPMGDMPIVKALVLKEFSPNSSVKSQHIEEMEDMAQSLRGSVVSLKSTLQIPELHRARLREVEFQNPFVFVLTPLKIDYQPQNPITHSVETPFFITQIHDAASSLLTDISASVK